MRLRKFNENLNVLDIEYIENCFIEFIYDHNKDNYIEKSDNEFHIQIFFTEFEKDYNEYYLRSLNKVEEHTRSILKIYENINECIDKVKLKYPNVNIKFEFSNNNDVNYHYVNSIGIFIDL